MTQTQNTPSDYKHIAGWGNLMGSMPYYIKFQQKLAASENAPLDAIYKSSQGYWVTFDEVTSDTARRDVIATVNRLNGF